MKVMMIQFVKPGEILETNFFWLKMLSSPVAYGNYMSSYPYPHIKTNSQGNVCREWEKYN